MKIHVHLQRAGVSSVSYDCIPIAARVVQPGAGGRTHYGDDLLERLRPTTVELAKAYVQAELDKRFGRSIEITWIDQTSENPIDPTN